MTSSIDPWSPALLPHMAALAGALFFILASAGGPLMALATELLAPSRKKPFMDKLALQAANLVVMLALALGLTVCALEALARVQPERFIIPLELKPFAWLCAGAFGAAFVLLAAYRASWKTLGKERKKWHKLLGILCVFCTVACLVLSAVLAWAVSIAPLELGLGRSLRAFWPGLTGLPKGSAFWPLLAQMLVAAPAAAGALCLPYLILRRTRDDFGRDYYAYVSRFAAAWTAAWAALQLASQGWLAYALRGSLAPLALENKALVSWGASGVLWLLAAACWLWISRSAAPMRLKPVMALALLLAVAAMAAQVVAVYQPLLESWTVIFPEGVTPLPVPAT